MSKISIYHNPRCSKSRESMEYLKSTGADVEVIEYLKQLPTKTELSKLLMQLNMKAVDLVRKSEAIYKERFKDKNFTEEEWISIMLEYPQLIERPIVLRGHKAVIGRPLENVIDLMK